MSNPTLIGGRAVRWDDERAADAYARGWWVRETLADSLADVARRTPRRVVLIDGDHRIDCLTLHQRATALAGAMLERLPVGSPVMLDRMAPSWTIRRRSSRSAAAHRYPRRARHPRCRRWIPMRCG